MLVLLITFDRMMMAVILQMRYYQIQRSHEQSHQASSRATVRLLESLLRLSEAHAKLMCKAQVDLDDAIVAIYLVGLAQSAYSGEKCRSMR